MLIQLTQVMKNLISKKIYFFVIILLLVQCQKEIKQPAYQCDLALAKVKETKIINVDLEIKKYLQLKKEELKKLDIPRKEKVDDSSTIEKLKKKPVIVKETASFSQIINPLESYNDNVLKLKPHVKYIINVDSYCMNSSASVPAKNEPFVPIKFKKENVVRKLLIGSYNKLAQRSLLQTMIWNLTRKRHPRDLPLGQRKLLAELGIISQDDVKILDIEKIMFDITSNIFGGLIVNTLDNFNITDRSILNRKSRFKLKQTTNKRYCLHPFVIEHLSSHGYSKAKIMVYNTSNEVRDFVLSNYYFKPKRKDVQPLAMELSRKRALLKKTTKNKNN